MAGTHLQAAQETFAALDARPYLDRCQRELAACGWRSSGDSARRDSSRLTNQELAVAKLVANGLTNRKVARELVVSEKTVEYHLRNVFAKLDLTSRTQLARTFTDE
ncbi:MAG: helix-turn-helix domain-containing protein [Frankia sp.]